jgi:hypothetical protein
VLARVLDAARGPATVIAARLDALAQWYGEPAYVETIAGDAVTVASIGGQLHGAAFGEQPPATIDLLRAGPDELRRYAGGGAALARSSDRVTLVGGAGVPATLFEGVSSKVEAFATHAVAAGFVAYGAAVVDPTRLPELAAYGALGGDRTLVAAVRALPPATLVDLDAVRATVFGWWPDGAKPEPLREALRQRLVGIDPVYCAGDCNATLTDIGIEPQPWQPGRATGDVRWTDGQLGVLDLPEAGAVVVDSDAITEARPLLTLEGASAEARALVPEHEPDPSRALRAVLPRSNATIVAIDGQPDEPFELPLPSLDREAIARDYLAHPLLGFAFGERWAARMRSRFVSGQATAAELALRVAGPIALALALEDLS